MFLDQFLHLLLQLVALSAFELDWRLPEEFITVFHDCILAGIALDQGRGQIIGINLGYRLLVG